VWFLMHSFFAYAVLLNSYQYLPWEFFILFFKETLSRDFQFFFIKSLLPVPGQRVKTVLHMASSLLRYSKNNAWLCSLLCQWHQWYYFHGVIDLLKKFYLCQLNHFKSIWETNVGCVHHYNKCNLQVNYTKKIAMIIR
jgi:hypothetical protein